MQVLGLDPVLMTVAICVIGVTYQIITGMAGKSWSDFNPTLALSTFMIGMVTSSGLVAPVIDALPEDMDTTLQLAAVVGQVGLVMGIDSGVRKGQKISQRIKDKKTNNSIVEPEPIDDPNDLPPGKQEEVKEKP